MDAWALANLVFGTKWVQVVLFLVLANVVLGLAVSLYTGTFRLGETGSWLRSRALPLLMGAGVAKVAALIALPELGLPPTWADAVWLWVIATLVGKIVESFREMGAPLPAALGSATSDAPGPPVPPPTRP
jgi:hypothetical protein